MALKAIITLLKTFLLSHYPSGSAINYHDGLLYVIGDDANKLLVLDSHYNQVDSVSFFHFPETRIPKARKPDLETAVILDNGGQKSLLALGSAATKERETGVLLGLPVNGNKPRNISSASFMQRLRQIPEINIEGATLAGQHLVLANRGNESRPVNHLIITAPDFYERQESAPVHIAELTIPFPLPGFAGVSELCYIAEEDVLLVALSSEATGNAYDDGAIGDSYLAWIKNFSGKLHGKNVSADGIVNLPDVDDAFKGEKVEGICLSAVAGKEWFLHLVADDDKGASRLFHIKMVLEN